MYMIRLFIAERGVLKFKSNLAFSALNDYSSFFANSVVPDQMLLDDPSDKYLHSLLFITFFRKYSLHIKISMFQN